MLPAPKLPEGLEPRDPDARSVHRLQSGIWRYRPSSLGSCLRALLAERTGYEPMVRSERNQRILAEGHLHEDSILAEVERHGYRLLPRPSCLAMRIGDYAEIVGEVDGIAVDDDGNWWLVEAKTAGETDTYSTFKTLKRALTKGWEALVRAEHAYAFQVTTYSALIQACYGIEVKGVVWGLKNRNDGEFFIKALPGLPFPIGDPPARVALIEGMAMSDPDQRPPCDVSSPFCKFKYLHDKAEAVRDDSLTELAEKYHEAQQQEVYWKGEKNAVKPQLEDATRGEPKTVAGPYSIVWTNEKETVFDLSAALNSEPDAVKPYITTRVVEDVDVETLERERPDLVARYRKPKRKSHIKVFGPRKPKTEAE